ncbi:hypothetical protein WME98_51255 [Sorangium sp. So ce296]|uniref:hypothetical protein n=1 Tax=Sorangium sp. So ce296 TaxID=3133296 RepID=UPI003F5DFC3D
MSAPDDVPAPRVVLHDPEDELAVVLRTAQRLLLRYPAAAQALFRAFAAEGRAFAQTPEGRRWREELSGSELIRRGRVVWEVGTLNLLEEDADTMLPSKLLDAIVHTAGVDALEPLLSRLFESAWERDDAR